MPVLISQTWAWRHMRQTRAAINRKIASESFMTGWEKVKDWLYLWPGRSQVSGQTVTSPSDSIFHIKFGKNSSRPRCFAIIHVISAQEEMNLDVSNLFSQITNFDIWWRSLIINFRIIKHFLSSSFVCGLSVDYHGPGQWTMLLFW